MKFSYAVAFLLLCCCGALSAQHLVSTTLIGTKTKAQLISQFGLPNIQFGVKYYRMIYTTNDVHGLPDTVSGLVVVPNDLTRVFPRLVYQHGTSGSKLDVPSYNVVQGGEGTLGLLVGGLGFCALMPDYLGLGISDGFHPYVHAASEASVAVDMLLALPEFQAEFGIHLNDQLFMTGYSQGGHASMALQREIETNLSTTFTVTAAAHNSGPYSIGEVMRDLILSDSVYDYPGYLPNTILSYQSVYGGIFTQLSDIFKDPYAAKIAEFYNGSISLDALNAQLTTLLTTTEGSCRPLRMLQPAIVQLVRTDPSHPFNEALRDNNVYAWGPKAPTRLYYCQADDQVPYLNSIVARDTMLARGASNLVATDVNSTADHGGCYAPAMTNTLFFFLSLQQIGVFVSTGNQTVEQLEMQPNPSNTTVLLRHLPAEGQVSVTALDGRRRFTATVAGGDQTVDVSGLENGLYLVQYLSEGKVWQGKLAVQR